MSVHRLRANVRPYFKIAYECPSVACVHMYVYRLRVHERAWIAYRLGVRVCEYECLCKSNLSKSSISNKEDQGDCALIFTTSPKYPESSFAAVPPVNSSTAVQLCSCAACKQQHSCPVCSCATCEQQHSCPLCSCATCEQQHSYTLYPCNKQLG